MFIIESLPNYFDEEILNNINNKTKPLGALGTLESLALQLCKIQLSKEKSRNKDFFDNESDIDSFSPTLVSPHLMIFAGDHGVAAEGVSIAPSEVTGQMVSNFSQGGAAINVFCRQFGWEMSIIDAGILTEPMFEIDVINQRLGNITKAINKAPAMTVEQVEQGFKLAKQRINEVVNAGCNVIAFGEMGIGNTTVASAIMSAITGFSPEDTVGRGTGVSDDIVERKKKVVAQALALHKERLSDPISLLACLGGFEIVQITAAMLACAEHKITIVVDGFICTAAAMIAIEINPNVKDYMVFAHCSGEQGHQKMLEWLNVKALLNLGLRLGEGTGAALSLPLLQAAIGFYNDMASFAQAAVTNVVES